MNRETLLLSFALCILAILFMGSTSPVIYTYKVVDVKVSSEVTLPPGWEPVNVGNNVVLLRKRVN